jgi:hypothetical protein
MEWWFAAGHLAGKERGFAWAAFAGEGVGGAAGRRWDALKRAPTGGSSERWGWDAVPAGGRVNPSRLPSCLGASRVKGSRKRGATDGRGERAELAGG